MRPPDEGDLQDVTPLSTPGQFVISSWCDPTSQKNFLTSRTSMSLLVYLFPLNVSKCCPLFPIPNSFYGASVLLPVFDKFS